MRLWPQYHYDDQMVLKPNDEAPKINFDTLKKLLLSTDIEASEKEYEALIQGETKFLDGKVNMMGNRVLLASFPRSGNSFLRK